MEEKVVKRKSLNSKYSHQFPFKKISRTPCGKVLLQAQRFWRDGTALLDGLGIPMAFPLKEAKSIVGGASGKERKLIFCLCAKAILMCPRAVDFDLADFILLYCLCLHSFNDGNDNDSNADADIVFAFCTHFFFLNQFHFFFSLHSEQHHSFDVLVHKAYAKAMRKTSDPRLLVIYSSVLISMPSSTSTSKKENVVDVYSNAISTLRRSLESFEHPLSEVQREKWTEGFMHLDAYFLLAQCLSKQIDILAASPESILLDPTLLTQLAEERRTCLQLFVNKAHESHYNFPHACFLLSAEWVRRKTPVVGCVLKDLLERNKEDVKFSIEMFDRGIKSAKIFVKWNPNANSLEKRGEYVEALELQKLMRTKEEDSVIESLPKSQVEMMIYPDDEDELTWNEYLRLNLLDSRNIQLVYLFLLLGIMLDPIFNVFGIFVRES